MPVWYYGLLYVCVALPCSYTALQGGWGAVWAAVGAAIQRLSCAHLGIPE